MNRIGVHVNSWQQGVQEMLGWWGPPIIVSLEPHPALLEIKARYPETTIILRKHMQQFENEARGIWNEPMNPKPLGIEIARELNEYAAPIRDVVDYVVGFNEPVVWSKVAMHRYAEFEMSRMEHSDFPCVIGNFSVAHPHEALWLDFTDALGMALETGGAVATHEYAWPVFPPEPDGFYVGRVNTIDGILPQKYHRIPWFITECGIDRLLDGQGQTGGWKDVETTHGYVNQLRHFESFYINSPHKIKAAVFCMGTADPTWASYDILGGVADMLANQDHNEQRRN